MKFTIERRNLLKPLQKLSSLLAHRTTKPILSHLLLQVTDGTLSLTATDLEIEIVSNISISHLYEKGETTVPARKFFNIFRSLPEELVNIEHLKRGCVSVSAGRSRFLLSTLPASDFPNLDSMQIQVDFMLLQRIMKRLIESTQFSMAHQDVRYYLNGMFFEIKDREICVVATDGHRLAVCRTSIGILVPHYTAIIPRKGIIELMRMLDGSDIPLRIQIGRHNIRAYIGNFIFTSKLIDGHFPDYRQVLTKNSNNILESRCDVLKEAFTRMAIISNDRSHGVRLYVSKNKLKLTANNTEQEEAEEILDVTYSGIEMEIGLNVSYILDVLNTMRCKNVRMLLTDSMSSVQIEDMEFPGAVYVIMPMRL